MSQLNAMLWNSALDKYCLHLRTRKGATLAPLPNLIRIVGAQRLRPDTMIARQLKLNQYASTEALYSVRDPGRT